jgi:hypothetical protein
MKLGESSLLASFSSVNRYSARDIADLTFLYCIALHVLRANWETASFAKTYAHKTIIYGNWDSPHINGTDLYQLLNITLYHSEKFINHLKNHEASQHLLHDILLQSSDVKRFLNNIMGSHYDDHLSGVLLLRFERNLRIGVTNYKSVRRICSDWNSSHVDDEAKSLAVTRLLQAMKYRALRGDLMSPLQNLAREQKLEITTACNPESGENCSMTDSEQQPKKLNLLKQLAITAGLGIGAYYLGKALAGGFKK